MTDVEQCNDRMPLLLVSRWHDGPHIRRKTHIP